MLFFGLCSITRCQRLSQPLEVTPKLKLRLRLTAQSSECFQLLRAERPGHPVEYAQGSKRLTIRHQGCTSIKTDLRFRNDQRILRKPLVLTGIGHNKNI